MYFVLLLGLFFVVEKVMISIGVIILYNWQGSVYLYWCYYKYN